VKLQDILTEEQRAKGLNLVELDDHTVELKDKDGQTIAVWSSSRAWVKEVREQADKYIEEVGK